MIFAEPIMRFYMVASKAPDRDEQIALGAYFLMLLATALSVLPLAVGAAAGVTAGDERCARLDCLDRKSVV